MAQSDLNNSHHGLPSFERPTPSSGVPQTVLSFSSGSLSILPRENLLILHPPTNHAASKPPPRGFVSGTLSFQHPYASQIPPDPEPKPLKDPYCQSVPPLESKSINIKPDDNDTAIVSGSLLPQVKENAEVTKDLVVDSISSSVDARAPQSATDQFVCETLRLPVGEQYDKARRVLQHPQFPTYLAVSMYGTLEEFEVTPSLKHRPSGYIPTLLREPVDDACVLSNGTRSVVIFSRLQESHQLSAVHIGLPAPPLTFTRPWNKAKRAGVSSVTAMMQPLMFATGGYDHVIHLWEVKSDFSAASPKVLAMKHNSLVQSLLSIRDTSHKLMSGGADCTINLYDLASERVVNTLKTSNIIYHSHTTSSPFCTLTEVAHRDLQFELRDHRVVPEIPVQRFGHSCAQVNGRYIRGASLPSGGLFACGDRDGTVRLWDLRRSNKVIKEISCSRGQKIVHVVPCADTKLLACSENGQLFVLEY
ncbi:WD40-repeat-containing domain protein [Desarmillaria tabescens]|uniref:WD40-repeat-containing domain protein n=1 Tax=Armillaria tabescens TaxID=1929756 RepID=A0AA39T6J7_ARMTA|nr:WD40-repeat-containing domain protein [Desarmillaria tabescens]KAK0467936.1 WD40-repeat-containing domain protein [Desarmillaria tabescens]